MPFTIQSVKTAAQKQEFLEVARVIYRSDPNWICPLDRQLHAIFEPATNPYFQHGRAERWILKDQTGHLVGRIAAFIDDNKKQNSEVTAGGVGFFECIDDQQAANCLFDTARNWLTTHQVEAMDGPINFGENDRFWGLLVDGYTEPPFTTNYNLPYYQRLFETYGFRDYYQMISTDLSLAQPFDPRFEKIRDWISQKEHIRIRHPERNELSTYAGYFREIYNEAWRFHEAYKPISEAQSLKFAKEIGFLYVKAMLTFAFVNGEPAGFLVCTPDLNQVFKPLRGKLTAWQLLLFMWRRRNDFAWYRKRGILTRGHVVAIGIKPKFQQYGLEAGMIMTSADGIRRLGFTNAELRWTGDFNPKINRLTTALGAVPVRRHITYRYLFDQNRVFERYKAISMSRGKVQDSA
ncbi:GNAT family N-acetyltransferase [Larkinella ripae]